jgi:hypothetical protein
MNKNVEELVRTLELLGERIQESANKESTYHLEISYYLNQASFSCWKHAQEIKEASLLLGGF